MNREVTVEVIISDEQILADLKKGRVQEREAVLIVLKNLALVDERKLFLKRGYSSLYTFCMEYLGYTEDEAYIRIQAMRLIRSLPTTVEKIGTGILSLSVAAKAQTVFRRKEKQKQSLTGGEKTELIAALLGKSVRQAEKQIASLYPETQLPQEKIRPLTEDLTRIEFSASNSLMEKLERLRGLLAHKNFDGRMDGLIEELADIALRKLDRGQVSDPRNCSQVAYKQSGGEGQHNRQFVRAAKGESRPAADGPEQITITTNDTDQITIAAKRPVAHQVSASCGHTFQANQIQANQGQTSPEACTLDYSRTSECPTKRSRYILKHHQSQVWQKANSRCEYLDPTTGRRCESQHALQIDHILEFAKGGSNQPKNLRLFCSAHNRWRSVRRDGEGEWNLLRDPVGQ